MRISPFERLVGCRAAPDQPHVVGPEAPQRKRDHQAEDGDGHRNVVVDKEVLEGLHQSHALRLAGLTGPRVRAAKQLS